MLVSRDRVRTSKSIGKARIDKTYFDPSYNSRME
jgi:hypothetical protein